MAKCLVCKKNEEMTHPDFAWQKYPCMKCWGMKMNNKDCVNKNCPACMPCGCIQNLANICKRVIRG